MVTVNFSEFGEKSITVGFWYNQKTLEKTKKTIVIKPGDEFFFIMNLNKSKKNLLNQTSKTDAQKVIENIASVNRLNLHFSESDSITTSFFVQKNLTEENSNSQQAQNQEKKDSLLLKETQTPPLITLTTTTASQLQPSDIDTNIPLSSMRNENKYALIIGNENYQSDKGINSEANVDYAINDAKSFLLYAESTLGIPKKNIQFLIDAKAIETHNAIKKIMLLMKATNGESEFLIYYAGHGIPDEKTGESYILPVDVQSENLNFAIKLDDLFANLSKYPTKRVTVFLDACFSGGARGNLFVSSRGVKVRPKANTLNGNIVVFSASSESQSALPFEEQKHGLFTYFLLKKIKETEGNCSYEELAQYLIKTVNVNSILINNKEQTPCVNFSNDITDQWSEWKIN